MAREHFFELTDYGTTLLGGNEVLLSNFVGEHTDFVRFNHARVRQAMTIRQGHLSLSLIDGGRRDSTTLSLSGNRADDRAQVSQAIQEMRSTLPALPEDPFLLYSTEPTSSERVELGQLPEPAEALETVLGAAAGTDFVGLSSCGPMQRGFASSLGHRHWHEVGSFSLDFSLYHSTDKAVSRSYSTARWNAAELEASLASARGALSYLAHPPKTIPPGDYRAYLSPAAVAELVAMLNWGGVSAKAQRTQTSCIQKLSDGELTLSPQFTLSEATESGLAPAFDEVGFQKPARVALIDGGRHAGALTGPRTAKEYGIAANADGEEGLHSAEVAAGSLAQDQALSELGDGVFIGNLWYLNFSDRPHARITGMTRFATFWVEGGQIRAPLNVMRFDDSLFRLLGDKLLGLTRERDWVLSSSSYGQRSVETSRLPGALVRDMTFTL